MRAIIVDDERFAIKFLENLCVGIKELELVAHFENAHDAIVFLKENAVELVFMDIEMPGTTGLDAARQIKQLYPDVCVIFVTGYEQYAIDAFRLDAASYITKPCSQDDLRRAVARAMKLAPTPRVPTSRVEIRTFGRFALVIDGQSIYFANRKAKELLALLVDQRGSVVRMEYAASVLWEDAPYDNVVKQRYRKAVAYLHALMLEKNVDFFVSSRGACQIIPEKIECDYYRLLKRDPEAISQFHGEYMLDYDWAEPTAGNIEAFLKWNPL